MLMISLSKLYFMNWTFMCLWIPTIGTKGSLGDWSPGCFQWWYKNPKHGHQKARPQWKPQHLVPSSQCRIILSRIILCSDKILDKWVSRYPHLHLYLWTTGVWCWTQIILVAPWTGQQWLLDTILLRNMIINMLWRWGRYTPETILQKHSPNPWWSMIFMGFTMSTWWMDKEHSGSHPR